MYIIKINWDRIIRDKSATKKNATAKEEQQPVVEKEQGTSSTINWGRTIRYTSATKKSATA